MSEENKEVKLFILLRLTKEFDSKKAKNLINDVIKRFNGKIIEMDKMGIKLSFPNVKSATKAETVLKVYAKEYDLDIDAKIL